MPSMTYITKIMLRGIANKNTEYFVIQMTTTKNLKYIQLSNYATITEVSIKTMSKIIWYFRCQTLNHASTINVAIRETNSSQSCDHASTVAMSSEIP